MTERFAYDGPGRIRSQRGPGAQPLHALFVTTDAVIPPLAANPEVTLVEREIIAALGGWEPLGRFWALRGWRRRLGTLVGRHGVAAVVGMFPGDDRIEPVREVIYRYHTRRGWQVIDRQGWETLGDVLAFEVSYGITKIAEGGFDVTEVTVVTLGDQGVADDVVARLADLRPGVVVTISLADPILGVVDAGMALPPEFAGLDAELDAIVGDIDPRTGRRRPAADDETV